MVQIFGAKIQIYEVLIAKGALKMVSFLWVSLVLLVNVVGWNAQFKEWEVRHSQQNGKASAFTFTSKETRKRRGGGICKLICFTKMKNKQWRQCLTLTFQRLFKNPQMLMQTLDFENKSVSREFSLTHMTGFKVFLGYH